MFLFRYFYLKFIAIFQNCFGKEHQGLCPWTPAGERVSFPHPPFLRAGVGAAIFFYRRTWPAAFTLKGP